MCVIIIIFHLYFVIQFYHRTSERERKTYETSAGVLSYFLSMLLILMGEKANEKLFFRYYIINSPFLLAHVDKYP